MSYFTRRAAKQLKQAQQREAQRKQREHERALEVDAQLRRLEEAYFEARGEKIALHYRSGWVYIGKREQHRLRLLDVAKMTAELQAEVHDKELDPPVEPD